MNTYRPLYIFRINHDYFCNSICRSFQLRLYKTSVDLCHRRGLLLKQTAVNEWTVLYVADHLPSINTTSDELEIELSITDSLFVLYTEWASIRPDCSYNLTLPTSCSTLKVPDDIPEMPRKRRIGDGIYSVKIPLTEEIYRAAQTGHPVTTVLQFQATKRRWEYLFFPSSEENLERPQYQLKEQNNKITFGPSEVINIYNRTALRILSQEFVPMKENYDIKLRLLATAEGREHKRIVLKEVPLPEVGKFLDAEKDFLRQVYFL